MPRNERAQWARVEIDGVVLLADLAAGASLARPVQFEEPQLRCFGAPAARSVPLGGRSLSARAAFEARTAGRAGPGCNCSVLTLTPHANGTHTECVGHLTTDVIDAYRTVPQRLLMAAVLTVVPERARPGGEGSEPAPQPGDLLITRRALEQVWPNLPERAASAPAPVAQRVAPALVIRTLPNSALRFLDGSLSAAPYLSREAATLLVERGIEHVVLDVPSADRVEDGGTLTAHRIFFGLPPGAVTVGQASRPSCTITELAYVDDAIADGWYLLQLQTPAIAGDAVPSRPVLYPLRPA